MNELIRHAQKLERLRVINAELVAALKAIVTLDLRTDLRREAYDGPCGIIGPQIENLEWHPDARIPRGCQEFVYFIECNEYVKIGYTTRPGMRFFDLVSTPYTLRVLLVVTGTRQDEREYHIEFGKHRHKGEWFRKSPELMTFIEECRNKTRQFP